MWLLKRFGTAAGCLSVPSHSDLPGGRYPTEPLNLPPGISAALSDARKLLADLRQILALMEQRGQHETPEFQKLLELAQELSSKMMEARARPDASA